jgi:SsrA-binding protein
VIKYLQIEWHFVRGETELGEKVITINRQVRRDYQVLETYEAGVALRGTEVKSLRAGRANLKDSYARVMNGEVFLLGAHISEYEQGNRHNHVPKRDRKLLLHKREIVRLNSKISERGLTLVPLRMYFKRGKAKVELGLARGRKLPGKREELRRRVMDREMEKALKDRMRSH